MFARFSWLAFPNFKHILPKPLVEGISCDWLLTFLVARFLRWCFLWMFSWETGWRRFVSWWRLNCQDLMTQSRSLYLPHRLWESQEHQLISMQYRLADALRLLKSCVLWFRPECAREMTSDCHLPSVYIECIYPSAWRRRTHLMQLTCHEKRGRTCFPRKPATICEMVNFLTTWVVLHNITCWRKPNFNRFLLINHYVRLHWVGVFLWCLIIRISLINQFYSDLKYRWEIQLEENRHRSRKHKRNFFKNFWQ